MVAKCQPADHPWWIPSGGPHESPRDYFRHAGAVSAEHMGQASFQGLAEHDTPNFFYLTYSGALLALDKGEKLDVEDFPEAKVAQA